MRPGWSQTTFGSLLITHGSALCPGPAVLRASRSAQKKHGLVVKILSKLVDQKAPELVGYNDDDFLSRVVEKMRYFIRFEQAGGAAQPGTTLFGTQAYEAHFRAFKLADESNTGTEENGRFLAMWANWAGDTIAEEADALSKKLIKAAPVAPAAPKSKKSKAALDAAVAEAAAMFG